MKTPRWSSVREPVEIRMRAGSFNEGAPAMVVYGDPDYADGGNAFLQIGQGTLELSGSVSSDIAVAVAGNAGSVNLSPSTGVNARAEDPDAAVLHLQWASGTTPTELLGALMEAQGAGSSKFDVRITSAGNLVVAKNSAPSDGSLNNSDCGFWFDATNGAPKLMLKGKQANGTVVTASIPLA